MKLSLELYVDESGSFIENNPNSQYNEYPSQLAGLLVPKGTLDEEIATNILQDCCKSSGRKLSNKEFHSNNIKSGANYDTLVTALIKNIARRDGWQPVRLVNQEEIYFGGFTDYVSMIGELALRIFIEQAKKHTGEIVLDFYCATRTTKDEKLYEQTIRNYIAFAAVRRGVSKKSARWRIGSLRIRHARGSRRLQICDLLSNSSYGEYAKCGDETKKLLKKTFGNYSASMVLHRELEQCDRFINSGSLGLAIRVLAERLNQPDQGGKMRSDAIKRIQVILNKLGDLTTNDRNVQLSLLINWLEQLIEQQRSLSLSYRVALWLNKQVYRVIRETMPGDRLEELDWFNYSLNFWLLTASNHQGNLINGRQAAQKLVELMPSIAQQWEHTNLLMLGLVADAVHRTDCWEYDTVAVQMKLVADYFTQVSGLFNQALPEVFSNSIHSQLRGKALGTWLQSEIYASAAEPDRLHKARGLSGLCIEEFANPNDKAIQYQYRCQLETIARDFPTAREYLAKSLNLENSSHQAIAFAIRNLTEYAQGFALLNWLRLGTTAYLSNSDREWSEFNKALTKFKLLQNPWCTGKQYSNYPVHGILRRVALIESLQGNPLGTAFNVLRNLNLMHRGNLVLALIQCAAYAETAAFCWADCNSYAIHTLDSNGDLLGLKQRLEILAEKSHEFPNVNRLTRSWLEVVREVLTDGENAKDKLLSLGMQIIY